MYRVTKKVNLPWQSVENNINCWISDKKIRIISTCSSQSRNNFGIQKTSISLTAQLLGPFRPIWSLVFFPKMGLHLIAKPLLYSLKCFHSCSQTYSLKINVHVSCNLVNCAGIVEINIRTLQSLLPSLEEVLIRTVFKFRTFKALGSLNIF